MSDTERIDWLIKVNAMVWNDNNNGRLARKGFTVCVPDPTCPGKHEVESGHKDLRKAIDKAYRVWKN